jgi:hypothetical protein
MIHITRDQISQHYILYSKYILESQIYIGIYNTKPGWLWMAYLLHEVSLRVQTDSWVLQNLCQDMLHYWETDVAFVLWAP